MMINEKAYALGANRSCIRDLFEYGRQRAAIVGDENIAWLEISMYDLFLM